MNKKEAILLWSSNLWMFGAGLLGPLFAIFTEEVGGNILDITSAWATYMIVMGVLTVIIGKWGDRIGHERPMNVGYALNAIFTFGYLLVDSIPMLFLVQAGLGIASALTTPTWAALYDKYSDEVKDGSIWGAAYGHGYIATGIAAITGGLIVTHFSFAALFVVMGTVHTVATLVQVRMSILKEKG